MNDGSLQRVTKLFAKLFRELKASGVVDHEIRHRYAEFLIASMLAKRGHAVQVLQERENKDADLYLPETKQRIEVKSGKAEEDGWVYASFGKGTQISRKRFDICAFVTFSAKWERVENIFVFTHRELREVCRKRKRVARYEATNPSVLMLSPSVKEFDVWTKTKRVRGWNIERALLTHPERFKDAWGKLR